MGTLVNEHSKTQRIAAENVLISAIHWLEVRRSVGTFNETFHAKAVADQKLIEAIDNFQRKSESVRDKETTV